MKVILRRTVKCPCPIATSKAANRLWSKLRGKELAVDAPMTRGAECGSKRGWMLADEKVAARARKLYGVSNSYTFWLCEHVVLREKP